MEWADWQVRLSTLEGEYDRLVNAWQARLAEVEYDATARLEGWLRRVVR